MRIRRNQAVAIAVDYQEKLIPVMSEKEKLLDRSCVLLAGLKELGVPIAITQQYTKGLGMTVQEITEAAGTADYIEKISFSAYECVEPFIHAGKYVIICGVEAHVCVLQTVIDLKAAGYVPVLVADCISSRSPEDKKIALKRAVQEGAILTTCESLLFELLEVAGTPLSKKIQRLVK